jgi:hypothetical protein
LVVSGEVRVEEADSEEGLEEESWGEEEEELRAGSRRRSMAEDMERGREGRGEEGGEREEGEKREGRQGTRLGDYYRKIGGVINN